MNPNKKIFIAIIAALIIGLAIFGRPYMVALYKTITFKVVKSGDKFYATDEFAQSSISITLYQLIKLKTPNEIDKMSISEEKKLVLKKNLNGLANFKIIDSGAAFVADSLRKYKTLFLGDCLDTASASTQYENVRNISKMSINAKVVDLKHNNLEAIPANYKIADSNFYMISYGYGLEVK